MRSQNTLGDTPKTPKTEHLIMSIFIASTKSFSRGKGQSAVAAASYRAGVELIDERDNTSHNYSNKKGVMSADIILPTALSDAKIDRSELWNLAESLEKRKDARVAREWLINLPHELNEQDRKELAHTFAQTLADRYGVIADCCIHKPTDKEVKRGADPRNHHAHILFTTRTAELDQDNKIILTDKATIELSDTKRATLGLGRVNSEIKAVRAIWEQIANTKLAEHGHDLIDSSSYKAQGLDIKPQIKMGVKATLLERRTGELSYRGEFNRLINEDNELVWSAQLADNQLKNDAADAIIIKGHAIYNSPFSTPTPKAASKPTPIVEPEPPRPTPKPVHTPPPHVELDSYTAMIYEGLHREHDAIMTRVESGDIEHIATRKGKFYGNAQDFAQQLASVLDDRPNRETVDNIDKALDAVAKIIRNIDAIDSDPVAKRDSAVTAYNEVRATTNSAIIQSRPAAPAPPAERDNSPSP